MLSSFVLLSCDLMTIFGVMFRNFSLLCVSIIDFWFVVTMRDGKLLIS